MIIPNPQISWQKSLKVDEINWLKEEVDKAAEEFDDIEFKDDEFVCEDLGGDTERGDIGGERSGDDELERGGEEEGEERGEEGGEERGEEGGEVYVDERERKLLEEIRRGESDNEVVEEGVVEVVEGVEEISSSFCFLFLLCESRSPIANDLISFFSPQIA